MGGYKDTRPLCQWSSPEDVKDGTTCLASSPPPGPVRPEHSGARMRLARPPKIRTRSPSKAKPRREVPVDPRTHDLLIHIYIPITTTGSYTAQMLFAHILGPEDDGGSTRWDRAGITPKLYQDQSTAIADLQESLATPGAVVIYMGHTFFPDGLKKPPGGLALHIGKTTKQITAPTLVKWLNASNAAAVVLAGCSTDKCLAGIDPKGSSVVVATYSGSNATTNTLQWAGALESFLDVLVGSEIDKDFKIVERSSGSISDAVSAAAPKFGSEDHFVIIRGNGGRHIR